MTTKKPQQGSRWNFIIPVLMVLSFAIPLTVWCVFIAPPSHEAFLYEAYGSEIMAGVKYLNTQIPTDAKVITNLPLTYLINHPVYYVYDVEFRPDIKTAVSNMKKHGVTHVFYAKWDVADAPDIDVIEPNLDDSRYFREIFTLPRVRIFEVI